MQHGDTVFGFSFVRLITVIYENLLVTLLFLRQGFFFYFMAWILINLQTAAASMMNQSQIVKDMILQAAFYEYNHLS